ncbi:MAG: ABC transporter ATP-binding protein [Oscillospiraceae bacterium]|nr:ABC transporter ATP-binding protein [Oscillospiraceae bacterium]
MKKTVLKVLGKYIKNSGMRLLIVFVCALIGTLAEIAAPYLAGRAIDNIAGIGNVNFNAVARIIMILMFLYVVSSIMSYLVGRLSYNIAHKIVGKMRQDAYSKLMELPLNTYDTSSSGDIVSRFVNDATLVADGIVEAVTQLFGSLITIIGTLIVMIILSPIVTLCVLLVTSITFVVASIITKRSNKYFRLQQQETGNLGSVVEELVGVVHTVKAYSYEEVAQNRFEKINGRLCDVGQKAVFSSSLPNPTTRFVNSLAYILIGVIGGTIAGLTAGKISSFIIYSNQFAKPFNQITAIITQILAAYAAAGRVIALICSEPEIPEASDAVTLQNASGEVEFKNVNFSYNKNKPLIENYSLKVKKGQRVAIVGPTGAGKTTLVNLIMRFYDVNSGEILVDGIDIRKITRKSLRQNIAMVLQETWLKDGTVRDNIAYANQQATDEQVVEAAKRAFTHGFIKRLPKGYDTVIGGRGDSLSVGQRQLLTIARAMLSNSPILILDEATSNVDTMTEQRITAAINNLMEGTTSFIIAHRLSTIQDADLIVVMNKGHIVEQGTHTELIAEKGFYYNLYNSQFNTNTN